jgi:hypothetical protein
MDIATSGLTFGLLCVGAGLALMGYYIGKGLQNFRQPAKEIDYYSFLKESDLGILLNLSPAEITALLNSHPDIPKVVLEGKTFYPKKQLIEWMTSNSFNQK